MLDQFLMDDLCSAHVSRKSQRHRELLRVAGEKLHHMGISGKISHDTLAHANEVRDWRIYHDFAQVLIRNARELYSGAASSTRSNSTIVPAKGKRMDAPLCGRYRPTETDLTIQRRMIGYWTRMARTGNPNGGDDPRWFAHETGSDSYLEIGATTMARTDPSSAKCDFWDTVRLPWPHL
jgi:carboxylesterase type B